MIPRRIWVNLAAFLGLFGLLCNWAVHNVLSLDAIERPYRITATFESSPGLRANVEVTYLGVRVGTIERLHLEDEGVVAELDIHREIVLPVGLTAAVRRKSAVGEPYVALEPPAGGGSGNGAPTIDPDERYAIPVEQTTVPLAYGELFTSLDELINAVDPDDFSTVIHELALALGNRGPTLRRVLENVDDATSTLAARADLFDALAHDLTSLTHTISAEAGAIGSSFDDLALVTGTLASSRADIETLLSTAPDFGAQVATLLEATVADLGCTLADIGPVFAELGTEAHLEQLILLLNSAAGARQALDAALVEPGEDGADGPYLGGAFVPEAELGATPPTYAPNPELPAPPPLVPCAAGPGAAVPGADATVAAGGGGSSTVADAGAGVSERPMRPAPDVPPSSTSEVADDALPLGLYAAVLAAAAGVVLLAVLRRRQGEEGSP